MEEDEKINNPSVEYEMPDSYEDDYNSIVPPSHVRKQFNTVWQHVSSQDRNRIAIIILVAMLVMLLLNIVQIIKIFKS
jgi:hypothetical protein